MSFMSPGREMFGEMGNILKTSDADFCTFLHRVYLPHASSGFLADSGCCCTVQHNASPLALLLVIPDQ